MGVLLQAYVEAVDVSCANFVLHALKSYRVLVSMKMRD
jgi:hypothetical protein